MRRPAAFGIDVDRITAPDSPWRVLARRVGGRYPVDAFGLDPMIHDLVAPAIGRLFSSEVEGAGAVPEIGPAVLVVHRRWGPGDVLVVAEAVRELRRRRARLVGYPDLPGIGGAFRRMGHVRSRGEDLAALLRAGHLAVVSLGATRRPSRAGHAAPPVLWGAVGFPVLPVVVKGGALGPAGLPLGHHRITIGPPLDVDGVPRDPLSAAELAESARAGVQRLLDLAS